MSCVFPSFLLLLLAQAVHSERLWRYILLLNLTRGIVREQSRKQRRPSRICSYDRHCLDCWDPESQDDHGQRRGCATRARPRPKSRCCHASCGPRKREKPVPASRARTGEGVRVRPCKQAKSAIRVTAVLFYHRSSRSRQNKLVGRKDRSLFRRRCSSAALGKFQGLSAMTWWFFVRQTRPLQSSLNNIKHQISNKHDTLPIILTRSYLCPVGFMSDWGRALLLLRKDRRSHKKIQLASCAATTQDRLSHHSKVDRPMPCPPRQIPAREVSPIPCRSPW